MPIIADASSSEPPGAIMQVYGQAACQSAACLQKGPSGWRFSFLESRIKYDDDNDNDDDDDNDGQK